MHIQFLNTICAERLRKVSTIYLTKLADHLTTLPLSLRLPLNLKESEGVSAVTGADKVDTVTLADKAFDLNSRSLDRRNRLRRLNKNLGNLAACPAVRTIEVDASLVAGLNMICETKDDVEIAPNDSVLDLGTDDELIRESTGHALSECHQVTMIVVVNRMRCTNALAAEEERLIFVVSLALVGKHITIIFDTSAIIKSIAA